MAMTTHSGTPTQMPAPEMIEFRNVSKSFGPVSALSGVSFSGRGGTVHAITGENGAGKSTLMKMLAGIHQPTEGDILFEGKTIRFSGAEQAREAGISTVFQELTLLPNLTIAENIFLGREPRKFGLLDTAKMRHEARAALDHIGVDFDVDTPCAHLTISEQHIVEIAKAAVADSRVVIYDEPTAALDAPGVEKLLQLINEQKQAGKLIFYISHRLDEIFKLCDVTTILKDGQHVKTLPTAELNKESLVALMVGRKLEQMYPTRTDQISSKHPALLVDKYQAQRSGPTVSFQVQRGEIVGLAGIEGQGQRDIIRAIAGLQPSFGGTAKKDNKDGKYHALGGTVETIAAGVGFIPEDRKSDGLFLSLSIEQNIGLGMLRTSSLFSRAKIDKTQISDLMQKMLVRAPSGKSLVSSLSGGNQQKVMFGRWLSSGIDVLLIEEPTRGVDVAAKAEIYRLLRDFTDQGGAILLTSSELTEHIGLCDRILVVREGSIVAEITAKSATEEKIMAHALIGDTAQKDQL